MTAEGPFTLDPVTFALAPGETRTLAVSGDPRGRILARLSTLAAPLAGDRSAVTLSLLWPEPAPFAIPGAPSGSCS